MANPDIPAALVVIEAHLAAAGAALTDKLLDVDRGILTYGRKVRYYWSGECPPPHMGGSDVTNGKMVGQRFVIAAGFPITGLTEQLIEAIDAEMQVLATEIRTRLQGDFTLGGNVTALDLEYAEPAEAVFSNGREFVLRWTLDLAYVEYPWAP